MRKNTEKLEPGTLLVPPDHEQLISIPPWAKGGEEKPAADLPKGRLIRTKSVKNADKRRRRKQRKGKQRKSGSAKHQQRQTPSIPMPTPKQVSVLEEELKVLKTELVRQKQQLNSVTHRGERYILELDIESEEQRIEAIEGRLERMRQRLNEV